MVIDKDNVNKQQVFHLRQDNHLSQSKAVDQLYTVPPKQREVQSSSKAKSEAVDRLCSRIILNTAVVEVEKKYVVE